MKTLIVTWVALVALVGCSKPNVTAEDAAPPNATTATTTATATASASAGAKPPEADGGAPKGAAVTYAGKYSVTLGTMYVPTDKDFASVKFKNDESKLLGDGEITIAIDPSGRVSGGTEGSGPLGASVLDGTSEKGVVTGTLRRKDAADEGLTGTLHATITNDGLVGTMKLSEWNAAVVREAKLDAKKKN